MPTVRLRDPVRTAIVTHAREEAPNECCGLLIGHGSTIVESVRSRNLRESSTRYLLDPAIHIATNRRLRGTSRTVIGVYHSHPHSPAVPSDTDLAEALYPAFIWVIVSLAGAGVDVAAYRLVENMFVPIQILTIER